MTIRGLALVSILALTVASARAEEDIVVDKHPPWSTQLRDYCGPNPVSMRVLTAQFLSIRRCTSNFDVGEVKFYAQHGRTIAEWPIKGNITYDVIGFCSCMVQD